MQMLSDDDVNIRSMTGEELDAAWDLWFDLAQETNEFDPPYTHGVLVGLPRKSLKDLPAEMPDVAEAEDFQKRRPRKAPVRF